MQSLSSIIDFSLIQNQKASKNALEGVLRYMNQNGRVQVDKQQSKRRAHQFLTMMHSYLKQESNSQISKFYTLLILKFVTEKEERVILSVLTTHPLFKYMSSIASTADPYLPVEEKGKKIFQDPKIGRDYIRLILESIKVWGQKFSSNKKNQDSHFKKTYDDLLQKGVIMPSQLAFYNKAILSSMKSTTSQLKQRQNSKISPDLSPDMIKQSMKTGNNTEPESMKVMDEDINTIDKYISLLQGNDYEKYCHEYHKLFLKQAEKYEPIINQLISSGDEKGLQTALAINEFYTQQNNAYKQFLVGKTDYYSYVNLIMLKADEFHQTVKKTPMTKQYAKKQVKIIKVDSRRNNLVQSNNNQQNKQLVSQLMTKLNQKSISASRSFRQIKDSLSKEKSQVRLKRSTSGMRKSSVSRFGKSITKSRIASIFSNPPNPYPQDKRYQGQFVDSNVQMIKIMKNLTKNQGIRRFITSNFKTKNPLFQNSHIQIGFKSQPIYQQVPDYKTIISIELYIGNNTQDEINGLSMQYKVDSDLLLYATPKIVSTYLQSGYQIKHELLVIPLTNSFSFINLNLSYRFKGQDFTQKIVLPNSIVKFVQNSKISKKEFVQAWNASTIFRTQQFKLTRYISPDSLKKYVSGLSQLSSYDQFLAPDSETDFQLGCEVLLMKKYEGVLRISVRPNLNAVLQIGITDQRKQAHQGFVHYLQTLEMLLTHVDHEI